MVKNTRIEGEGKVTFRYFWHRRPPGDIPATTRGRAGMLSMLPAAQVNLAHGGPARGFGPPPAALVTSGIVVSASPWPGNLAGSGAQCGGHDARDSDLRGRDRAAAAYGRPGRHESGRPDDQS